MLETNILYPCLAMVGITAMVWVRLFIERLGEMRTRGIQPQDIATSRQSAKILHNVQASENFQNLFEVPVLFYALCALVLASHTVSPFLLIGAWTFVILRGLHSFVHCTYNHVMHRFILYLLSTLVLFAMWGGFALQLLNN